MAAMAAETATPVKAPELADSQQTVSQPVVAQVPKAAGKGKKDGKKDAKKKSPAEDAGEGPSLAGHPRAVRSVARAKSWGGLAGFLFAGYVSLPTSTIVEAGVRALAAGVVCYVATWAGAVFVWRRLVILEIKAREQQLITAARAAAGGGEPAAPGAPGGRAKAPGT